MVVAEAVAAMAATPAAIEVNLTIVFVLFVSADISPTRKKKMSAYSQRQAVKSALFIQIPSPAGAAQTSY